MDNKEVYEEVRRKTDIMILKDADDLEYLDRLDSNSRDKQSHKTQHLCFVKGVNKIIGLLAEELNQTHRLLRGRYNPK